MTAAVGRLSGRITASKTLPLPVLSRWLVSLASAAGRAAAFFTRLSMASVGTAYQPPPTHLPRSQSQAQAKFERERVPECHTFHRHSLTCEQANRPSHQRRIRHPRQSQKGGPRGWRLHGLWGYAVRRPPGSASSWPFETEVELEVDKCTRDVALAPLHWHLLQRESVGSY